MLHLAFIFLLVGIVAALFGFGGIASAALGAAKGLIFVKLLGVVLVLVGIGLMARHLTRGSAQLP